MNVFLVVGAVFVAIAALIHVFIFVPCRKRRNINVDIIFFLNTVPPIP